MFAGRLPNSFVRASLVLLIVFTFYPALETPTLAQKKKRQFGTIKILSNPGGLPLEVDGKSFGQTTTDFRAIDLDAGLHTIVVTLPSGKLWSREVDLPANRIKCITLNYKPGSPAATASPCPFHINISAPSQVLEGEVITYTTDAAYSGNSALRYNWTVTPAKARILSGAGTPTITVDSTGLDGQRITAKVVVDDGSGEPACNQNVEASTYVPPSPRVENAARLFDICCACSSDDQKARLDNLAVTLQSDPSVVAYLISYAGQASRAGHANQIGSRSRDYLVAQRRLNSSRVMVVDGGLRAESCLELWLVPNGARPPQPKPTVATTDRSPAVKIKKR